MVVTISSFYPNLKLDGKELGEISVMFYLESKESLKSSDVMVTADFHKASYVDENNRDVPMTKKELEALGVYEFFVDDAVEEFFESLREKEMQDYEKEADRWYESTRGFKND